MLTTGVAVVVVIYMGYFMCRYTQLLLEVPVQLTGKNIDFYALGESNSLWQTVISTSISSEISADYLQKECGRTG